MALIKHSNARTMARDAVVLDFGDLVRQGELVVAQARARADQIVAEAREERERLIRGAVDEGRVRGLEEGREQGRAEGFERGRVDAVEEFRARLEALQEAWGKALEWFNGEREHLVRSAERDVVRLAAMVAEKVVKRAVALDPGLVVEQMRAVLGMVVRPTDVVVSVHPDDRGLCAAALPGLLKQFAAVRHAELVEDAGLERGSCVARTKGEGAGGEIDASIGTQVDRIVSALLPERSERRGHGGEGG